MDQYELIRTAHRVYKKSIRQIARETGHTRKTIRKVLQGLSPKYRRKVEPACAVMDSVAMMVDGWLKADQGESRKQRHTAHRIYTRLVEEHCFKGGESTVRRWVRERKARMGMNAALAVVPLDAEVAREAEVDLGQRLGRDVRRTAANQVLQHAIAILRQVFCARLSMGAPGDVFRCAHESVFLLWRHIPCSGV